MALPFRPKAPGLELCLESQLGSLDGSFAAVRGLQRRRYIGAGDGPGPDLRHAGPSGADNTACLLRQSPANGLPLLWRHRHSARHIAEARKRPGIFHRPQPREIALCDDIDLKRIDCSEDCDAIRLIVTEELEMLITSIVKSEKDLAPPEAVPPNCEHADLPGFRDFAYKADMLSSCDDRREAAGSNVHQRIIQAAA